MSKGNSVTLLSPLEYEKRLLAVSFLVSTKKDLIPLIEKCSSILIQNPNVLTEQNILHQKKCSALLCSDRTIQNVPILFQGTFSNNRKFYTDTRTAWPISLIRDTVRHCVLLRKFRYYNFEFLLGQSRCKCPHKKLNLWYLYYLSCTLWHKIRTK